MDQNILWVVIIAVVYLFLIFVILHVFKTYKQSLTAINHAAKTIQYLPEDIETIVELILSTREDN